eukprot:1189875-Prorocentrum_minimum.AAC.2
MSQTKFVLTNSPAIPKLNYTQCNTFTPNGSLGRGKRQSKGGHDLIKRPSCRSPFNVNPDTDKPHNTHPSVPSGPGNFLLVLSA